MIMDINSHISVCALTFRSFISSPFSFLISENNKANYNFSCTKPSIDYKSTW